MPEFTPEQARVIAHERGNLLVSAAAGRAVFSISVSESKRRIKIKGQGYLKLDFTSWRGGHSRSIQKYYSGLRSEFST